MEIKIGVEKILEKIPPGPTGKLVIGGFIMSGVVKYSIGYLEKGFPNPLTPQVFTGVSAGVIIFLVMVYMLQHKRKIKGKP